MTKRHETDYNIKNYEMQRCVEMRFVILLIPP